MAQTKEVKIYLVPGTEAKMPTKAYVDDAGFDLYAIEDVTIAPGSVGLVRTGVCLGMPPGIFAQVNTRSSYGKNGIYVHHGVIDTGYTGEISIMVMNVANTVMPNGMTKIEPYRVEKGHRVAQLLFHRVEPISLELTEELAATERGGNGLGSSGK